MQPIPELNWDGVDVADSLLTGAPTLAKAARMALRPARGPVGLPRPPASVPGMLIRWGSDPDAPPDSSHVEEVVEGGVGSGWLRVTPASNGLPL